MLIIAKLAAKVLKILNSEISPQQIAAGFAYGALLGFIPAAGLLPLLLLILGFVININLAIMFVALGFFKLISFAIDPIANQIGFALLVHAAPMKETWTLFYNMIFVPYTRYNNTLVLGSLVVGILSVVPSYFFMRWVVVVYRNKWRERIQKFKIIQIFKASSFYKYYLTYKGLTGD